MSILEELDAQAQRVETACGDGAMVWRIWNARGGSPLVLLHGGSGSWRHWVKQIIRYAPLRCVIAPDLPGLGDSAMPPEPYDPPHTARVVCAGLPAVLRGERADLVGFSFGASVAGHVAADAEEAFRSLMLVGAGSLGVPRNPVPLEKLREKSGEARAAAHRFNLNSLMIADPAKIDELAVEIQERNTVQARFRSRQFAGVPLLKLALARTRLPLCVMWGERDQVAFGNIPARIAVVGETRPDASIRLVPGAGHWTMYEAPDAFSATMEEFQAGVRAAAPA